MPAYPKRLIEVDLPIREISAHARKEKSIRHGHISTVHIWWARRPLAACRAVLCASLWPDPVDENCPQAFRDAASLALCYFAEQVRKDKELTLLCANHWPRWVRTNLASLSGENPSLRNDIRYALLDFIADFANWDASTVPAFLNVSRFLTQVAHLSLQDPTWQLPVHENSKPSIDDVGYSLQIIQASIADLPRPLVVDPFAGGGAIPLEALRVGAEGFASDLNPLATLINKVTIEYIPRFGERLAQEVRTWGEWVKKEASSRLQKFYPDDPNGASPIGYLWARTIVCEGPNCGVNVPIIKNQIITDRKGHEAAISIYYKDGALNTKLIKGKEALKYQGGTSKRSSVTCPSCGYTTPRPRVAGQSTTLGFGYRLLAVCIRNSDGSRDYREPTERDRSCIDLADRELEKWKDKDFSGISAIPDEELPYLRSIFNVRVYGIDRWMKLFHRRQLLSAVTFTSIVRDAAAQIINQYDDRSFASAIIDCLALTVSNSFQYQCNIATYLTEGIKSAFIQGQSLPMKMDFIEANPLIDELAGGYSYSLAQHLSALESFSSFPYEPGVVQQASALHQILPNNSIDLLASDPPYYDVVPYADCSDFFYVWLRRMLHNITSFPTSTELSPKDEEIVQLAERNDKYKVRTKKWFEDKMRDALSIARESVKHNGFAVIVFAHKSTAAWEALLLSVLEAGWVITGSWPIDTEKSTRLRANDSAVLGSSIHLVCRPRESLRHNSNNSLNLSIGDWRNVLNELPVRIHNWLPKLALEGIVGADAIFACLGPSLEIFSHYNRVEKASGEQVTLNEFLEHVWAAVSREALSMIFEGADATGFEEDARLTAMWMWTVKGVDSNSSNGTGQRVENQDALEEGEESEDEEKKGGAITGGYVLEYDAARKIAQGLGAHLERLDNLVEVKGDIARLRSVSERARFLFGKNEEGWSKKSKKKGQVTQLSFASVIDEVEAQDANWEIQKSPEAGQTILDRLHQAMLLFASGRNETLRLFLVDGGVGKDTGLWRLAQALSALYPSGSEEKRWVDGVLARKKGLGF